MKKKTVFLIVSTCLLAIAIVLFWVYGNYAYVKSLSDYDKVSPSYEKTTALPVSDLKNLKFNDSLTLEDGAILTQITYEEFFEKLADNEENEVKSESTEKTLTDDETYNYYYYKKVFGLDGSDECEFKAQLDAVFILDDSNSIAQIEDVLPISTRLVSGPRNCEWVQMSVDRFPALKNNDSPLEKVEFLGSGYFDVKFEFPYDLLTTCGWTSPTLFMVGRYQCE